MSKDAFSGLQKPLQDELRSCRILTKLNPFHSVAAGNTFLPSPNTAREHVYPARIGSRDISMDGNLCYDTDASRSTDVATRRKPSLMSVANLTVLNDLSLVVNVTNLRKKLRRTGRIKGYEANIVHWTTYFWPY